MIGLVVAEAAALTAVLLWWCVFEGRQLRALGLDPGAAVQRCLKGAAVGALMMGFVVLIGYTLIDGAVWQVNPDAVRAAIVLVGGLLGFMIQGPSEEILFRGYVLETVRGTWGVRWAIVVSSLTFAVLHSLNPAFGVLPLVNLVLFGLGAALYKLYLDGNQLWGVFAIHAVWNWLQQVVFGLPNSGLATSADNTLFALTPNTALPDAFWGGGFGPEGTLAATVVLLALVGAGLRRARGSPACSAASSLQAGSRV
jgi:membrane protease YdiL (CAAX protease family)